MFKRLKDAAARLKREIRVYQLVLADPRTPRAAKWLLGLAVGYAVLPLDIIPDFIPVVGYLDDVLIVPTLVWLALRLVPKAVVDDCRAKAQGFPGTPSPSEHPYPLKDDGQR